MPTAGPTLSIASVSRSDQATLLDHLPDGAVEFERPGARAGELGEPLTALAIITLSMAAITGLCAWLASKGKGVNLEMSVKVPGVEAGFKLNLTGQSKPEAVRQELAARGVEVA